MALNLLSERASVVTPEMNFQATMAKGPTYAQQKEIRAHIHHPTGRHLPLSDEEQARPLYFMQHWGARLTHHWHQARQYAAERLAALSPTSQSEARQLYLARRNHLQLLSNFEPTQLLGVPL